LALCFSETAEVVFNVEMKLCGILIGFNCLTTIVIISAARTFAIKHKAMLAQTDCALLVHFNNKYICKLTVIYIIISDRLQRIFRNAKTEKTGIQNREF